MYTFFEPELPFESPAKARAMLSSSNKPCLPKFSTSKSMAKTARLKKQLSMSTIEKRKMDLVIETPLQPRYRDRVSLNEGSSVLDLKGDNYFSCTVARKRSSARYFLKTSNHVVELLKKLADHASSSSSS